MSHFCAHRAPRAGVDVIDSPVAALAVVDLAMAVPLTAETVVIVLDDAHRGRSIVVVDGTSNPDAVIEVVERLAESVASSAVDGSLVVATVRPGGGLLPSDADRWLEAADVAEAFGVELVEWFVLGDGTGRLTAWTPRDLVAEPARWTTMP